MVGFLHSIIRKDEKLLLNAFKKAKIEIQMLDSRDQILGNPKEFDFDIAIERCVSTTQGLYMTEALENQGIKCINESSIARICADKVRTSLKLEKAQIPQPNFRICFSQQSALEAITELGYPTIIKPVLGSWGRLLAKINDRDAAEAVLEHKFTLGNYQHGIIYLQQYIEKQNRDIRAFVIGERCVAAIYRYSDHWITNTARSGRAENRLVTTELEDICINAAKAVGGGILAIDLFETNNGLMVNEINHTMEYKNSISTTGVDIPAEIVQHIKSEFL